eukprot:m.60186 g.60186  ORF g.60186 m.60186 type:complete len:111 (-) comp7260_c0_seq1:149-481(-)
MQAGPSALQQLGGAAAACSRQRTQETCPRCHARSEGPQDGRLRHVRRQTDMSQSRAPATLLHRDRALHHRVHAVCPAALPAHLHALRSARRVVLAAIQDDAHPATRTPAP